MHKLIPWQILILLSTLKQSQMKKILSLGLIIFALLLPYYGVQKEVKPKLVDILELVIQAMKLLEE